VRRENGSRNKDVAPGRGERLFDGVVGVERDVISSVGTPTCRRKPLVAIS
jgi:hypothetical protein